MGGVRKGGEAPQRTAYWWCVAKNSEVMPRRCTVGIFAGALQLHWEVYIPEDSLEFAQASLMRLKSTTSVMRGESSWENVRAPPAGLRTT